MIKTEIKCYNENERNEVIKKLKNTGYSKISDCMWTVIFIKGNNEIIVNREY